VQDNQVRFQFEGLLDRFFAVSGLDTFDATARLQNPSRRVPHHLVIVGNQNPLEAAFEFAAESIGALILRGVAAIFDTSEFKNPWLACIG
jgi:hypothetical protein